MSQACRGVRGAICAAANTREAIIAATRELLDAMLRQNNIEQADIASIFFTVTDDIDAAYPAAAARELGLGEPAMLCAQEIPVPDGPRRCVRVLLHWNTTRAQSEIVHAYLGEASVLRPDRRWPRREDENGH